MLAHLAVLSCALVSQDPDLGPLRAAFRALPGDAPRVAIAVVPGRDPVVLARGKDAGGREVGESMLVPLGAASRLLVADALWHGKRVDPGVALLQCATIAGRADRMFRMTTAGMAEIALLKPLLLDDRAPDLATALRLHLAPHVPGLEPRDVRALGDRDGTRVLPLRAGLPAGIAVR